MMSSRSRLKVREIQVECAPPSGQNKDLENVNLMITMVRGPRGRRKLLGEAFVRQIYTPIVHFKVYDEGDVDALFQRFLAQLIHRGYRPIQARRLDNEGRWSIWEPCDLSAFDMSEFDEAVESDLGLQE